MKARIILFIILVSFNKLLLAQQPTSTFPATDLLPSVTLPPDVARVLRDYERAWQARDADALVALFTPDGFVMQPNRACYTWSCKHKTRLQPISRQFAIAPGAIV